MGRFTNKVAVISGAASGIGAATAVRLAEEDIAGLVLLDRNEENLKTVAQGLSHKTKVLASVVDIADEAQLT